MLGGWLLVNVIPAYLIVVIFVDLFVQFQIDFMSVLFIWLFFSQPSHNLMRNLLLKFYFFHLINVFNSMDEVCRFVIAIINYPLTNVFCALKVSNSCSIGARIIGYPAD